MDIGAVIVIPPDEARTVPKERVLSRPMRFARTNKAEHDEESIANSRIVTPGDVDPDGEVTVGDG